MNKKKKFSLYIFSSLISFLLIITNLFAEEKTLDLLKSLDLENKKDSNIEKMSLEELDELEKLQKELEKQQLEQAKEFLENSNKNKSESASSTESKLISKEDNKFFRKAYACFKRQESGKLNSQFTDISDHFTYNPEGGELTPSDRCNEGQIHQDFGQINFSNYKDVKFCYSINPKANFPPMIGIYIFNPKTQKKDSCTSNLDRSFEEKSYINGPINVDIKTGLFDVREIISQQKGKKDHGNKDLESKLQMVFSLISQKEYVENISKKSSSDLLKVSLFGIKLNDDISNYESLNKIMKPNWSYGLYPSSDPYITDNGVLNYVYTTGGGGFKKGDDYDGMYQHIYSGQVKNREADDMMTMLSEYDHFLVKPPFNNDNFENYIIKFDPITKKTVAVLAKFKESSKDDCEKISGQLKFWEIYGESYKKVLRERGLSFQELKGNLFIRGSDYDDKKFIWERGDPVNEIAQFGFTCEYHSFSVDRWIYIFDLRNEAKFYDNLHSILMAKIKKEKQSEQKKIE